MSSVKQLNRKYFKRGMRKGAADGFERGKRDGFIKGLRENLGHHALLLDPGSNPSFEVGVLQPFHEVRKLGIINYHVKLLHDVNNQMIDAADTIVFTRNVEPEALDFLKWAINKGKRTLYVIDDNFLALPSNSRDAKYYAERRQTFIDFLKMADTLVVGSPFFKEYLQTHFNRNVVCIPASIDFEWLDQAEHPRKRGRRVIIGYEGTAKEEDFIPVVPALLRILKEYGDLVRMEFFGFVPTALANHPQVYVQEEWTDYRTFIQKLKQRSWDIGLAPLNDNLFNYCKTNNKFREYSACRIPGIYSASPAYLPWVEHGETGFLTLHTPEGWYKSIKEMIDNRDMRLRIENKAENFSRTHFSISSNVSKWMDHFFRTGAKTMGNATKGSGGKPVKIFVISPLDISSYWVGVHQPLSILKEAGLCDFVAVTVDNVTDEALQAADLILFNRQIEPRAYAWLERANQLGKRTVYLIDDHFLAFPVSTGIGQIYADYAETYTAFLKNVQTVLVGAPYFAELVRNNYNPNVVCFQASVDFDWIDKALKPVRDDGRIIIGYEGSNKEPDFAVVVPALLQIMKEYKDQVKLEFFGYLPAMLQDHPQVSFIEPEANYKTFLHRFYQCTWDIGIAPLEDTLWNRCKTSNKFREYSACLIPGVFSDLPPYSDIVRHRETGYIVPHTTEGWYEGIKRMIEDSSLRSRIRANAATFARGYFTVEACVQNWRRHILKV